jgi:hypothetical protein
MPAINTSGLGGSVLDTIVDKQPHPDGTSSMLVRRSDGCVMSVQPTNPMIVQWRDPKNPPNPGWTPGAYEAALIVGPLACYAPAGGSGQAVYFSYADKIPND